MLFRIILYGMKLAAEENIVYKQHMVFHPLLISSFILIFFPLSLSTYSLPLALLAHSIHPFIQLHHFSPTFLPSIHWIPLQIILYILSLSAWRLLLLIPLQFEHYHNFTPPLSKHNGTRVSEHECCGGVTTLYRTWEFYCASKSYYSVYIYHVSLHVRVVWLMSIITVVCVFLQYYEQLLDYQFQVAASDTER